jgi:Zn-dependent protease
MNSRVKLGRIGGIPIGLNSSWFLVFGLLTWSLASGFFPETYADLPTAAYWLLGGLTSLLFFGSVLVHELAHAFFALRNGTPVRGITLFFFGGVAQIEGEPRSAGAEFRMAIAGPLASLALALSFGGLWLINQNVPYLALPSIWLAQINLTLAVFNLIPGFPLDGGRVLRALVWRVTGSLDKATRIATSAGQLVALGLISLGVFNMLGGFLANGLWLIFIGLFLKNAAASSQAQSNLEQTLRGVTVGQVMEREYPQVPGLLPVSQLVEDQVLNDGHSWFFVTENGEPRGLLSLRDIKAIPQRKWRYLTAGDVMIPLEHLIRVAPDVELVEALRLMDAANVAQAPVVEEDKTVGALSREQVLRYLRLRAELGV